MSSTTAITGSAALEELPNLKPGLRLAVLVEACADRLEELTGYQLVDFVAAVRRQVAHLEAVGLRAARELSFRPPGMEGVARSWQEVPEDHAAGELEAACGWSRVRADNYVGLAGDLGEDLTATLCALDAGEIEVDVAREIADGTAVFAKQPLSRRLVEAAVLTWIRQGIEQGMRRPRHKVRKRVEHEVLRVDQEAARKRHEKQVEDRNFGVSAAENSTADLHVTNLPADRAAEAYANVNGLARVAKRRGDERSMPQLRADIAASLLSGSANVIPCPGQQPGQPGDQTEGAGADHGRAERAARAAAKAAKAAGGRAEHGRAEHAAAERVGAEAARAGDAGAERVGAERAGVQRAAAEDTGAECARPEDAGAEHAGAEAARAGGGGAEAAAAAAREPAAKVPGRPGGRIMLVTTLNELLGTSSGNSTLSWVGAIGNHIAERIVRNNLDNPAMDYEIVVTDPRSGRVVQVHQLGGTFRGRLRELVEITRPSCDWYTCDKPSIDCEIDHRTERCRNGATDLHTGGPKCRTHHRDKNKGDWRDLPIPQHQRQPGDPAYRLQGPYGHTYPIEPTKLIPFPAEPPPF